MTLKVHRFTLYAAGAWLVLLVYFALKDEDAAVLSIVLTPTLGALVLAAVAQRHLVLSLFMGLAVLSHAVAPPFFFLRREFYTYGGGFGAVKDFNFGVGEFLRVYAYVLVFLAATALFTIALRRLWPPTRSAARLTPALGADARIPFGALLALFLIVVAAPASVFMYQNRIGITGVEPTVLPYRLTGLLTYFRMFVVPIAIFAGLAVARRTPTLTLLVLLYTALAGFASASRYVVLSSAAPAALFALLDRRLARFAAVATGTALVFVLVTASRDYVYTQRMPLVDLVTTTVRAYDFSAASPFDLVGGIANRLWGPQDVVLAYQHHVPSRLTAIVNYFSMRPVVEDLTQEFYGMTLAGDSAAFGVGIGYVPWMILLADASLPVLVALALVTGVLLSISEWLVDSYQALPGIWWRLSGQPLAVLFVYCLYPSNLNWWYQAVLLAALGLALMRLYAQARAHPASGAAPIAHVES